MKMPKHAPFFCFVISNIFKGCVGGAARDFEAVGKAEVLATEVVCKGPYTFSVGGIVFVSCSPYFSGGSWQDLWPSLNSATARKSDQEKDVLGFANALVTVNSFQVRYLSSDRALLFAVSSWVAPMSGFRLVFMPLWSACTIEGSLRWNRILREGLHNPTTLIFSVSCRILLKSSTNG